MSELITDTTQRIATSERIRVAALACLSAVLAVIFFALLVADEVQAAGL